MCDKDENEALACIECPNKDECDHYGSPHLDHNRGGGGGGMGSIFDLLGGAMNGDVLDRMTRIGKEVVKAEYMRSGIWPPDMPEELKTMILGEIEAEKGIAEKRLVFSRLLTKKMEIAIAVNCVPPEVCTFFLGKLINGLIRRVDPDMKYNDPEGLLSCVMEEFEDFSKAAMFDAGFLEKVFNMLQRTAYAKSQDMGNGVKMELAAYLHPTDVLKTILNEVDELKTLDDFQAYALSKTVESQGIAKEIHTLHRETEAARPGKPP